jgi:chemosensory pili system protein ChpB (putative protein-glutamate methylesterase)
LNPVKLAVVAEDSLQQHRLKTAISDFGCEVLSLSPQTLALKGLDETVSAWLLDLREDDELLESFLDLDQPILFGFEAAPSNNDPSYPKWEKRLYAKLKQLLGRDLTHSEQQTEKSLSVLEQLEQLNFSMPLPENVSAESGSLAKNIWVLGSSLGGPEAIKEFLDVLPAGLPVGFIYGQHIDPKFVPVLAQVLARHSNFKLKVAEHGMSVHTGEVLIVPAETEVSFAGGKVQVLNREWPGPYGPSVDQLILNVVDAFPKAGIMLFSGMGNDGAEALTHLKDKELKVWAQSSETCASAAMPDASRETGAVSFSGSPREMAERLVQTVQAQQILSKADQ